MHDSLINPDPDPVGDRLERELDDACQALELACMGASMECEARATASPHKAVAVTLSFYLFNDISPDALVTELRSLSESLRLHLANARSMGRKI